MCFHFYLYEIFDNVPLGSISQHTQIRLNSRNIPLRSQRPILLANLLFNMPTPYQPIGSWATAIATWGVWAMFLWVVFLILELRKRPDAPSFVSSLKLLTHMWLAILIFIASKVADNHRDPVLILFIFLVTFRYYKTVVNVWIWFQYRPAVAPHDFTLSSADCTVVVPTVGTDGNDTFAEMVTGILYNRPSHLIFSTATKEAEQRVLAALPDIVQDLASGNSTYLKERNISTLVHQTEIKVINADISNKRKQVVNALQAVTTGITVFADDSAIWHPKFLSATLPAFANDKVGFVGTRKWVKRLPRTTDASLTWLQNAWKNYSSGFWNTMGALYLIRHNFEAQATNAADGGIFCVSGRTSLIRSSIVKDKLFQREFTNEYVIPWVFGGFGPVSADDDNFLSRWVINHGWTVTFQATQEATMTTVLGKEGGNRFISQCERWSRTTFRQNPITLFVDRTIWWKWPVTVWTTYLPWLYNAALFWDPLLISTLMHTNFYASSEHRGMLIAGMVAFIWASKLIKTAPWFWKHPEDFFLYFFPIPAYPMFAYRHSLLKVYTALTFWDLTWSGRKLPSPTVTAEKEK